MTNLSKTRFLLKNTFLAQKLIELIRMLPEQKRIGLLRKLTLIKLYIGYHQRVLRIVSLQLFKCPNVIVYGLLLVD